MPVPAACRPARYHQPAPGPGAAPARRSARPLPMSVGWAEANQLA